MIKKTAILFSVFSIILSSITYSQTNNTNEASLSKAGSSSREAWVNRIFNSLSEDEKIGQLFMVAAYSNKDAAHVRTIQNLVTKHHIGGLIFMQGGPMRQAKLTNFYQSKAKVPLLLSMDAEWGLGMRLDSTISFPRQMTLGAIADDQYIYDMGKEIARQCKRLGVHVNFAPVVDVNVNPKNPVIGTRSFGEDKENVARKGIAYTKGMQHHGVIANAKHFPGHGDTDKDSHLTLPIIKHDKARLDSIELYPFKRLIADSVMSMMVAHLYIPSLDSTKNLATTLSNKVVNGLLKDSLGFEGLIFTDALGMQGVARYFSAGEVDAKALLAGNDVLLFSENVPTGVKAIKKAIEDEKITWEEIDKRVKKILRAKYFVGLHNYKPVQLKGLTKDLNSNQALLVKSRLYEQAVTLVKNENNLLPFQQLDSLSFASVVIGGRKMNAFQQYLSKYAPFENHVISSKASALSTYQNIINKVKKKKVVVVGLMGMNNSRSKNYGIHANSLEFIKRLEKETKVVVVVFGNPYSLKNFDNQKHLVCAYEKDPLMQKAAPQVLFGAVSNQATLPVTASKKIKVGAGEMGLNLKRFRYSLPEDVGMNSNYLTQKIDSITKAAIANNATPGCQVLIAKDGVVVFEKAYGHTSYSKTSRTTMNTVYDIASLTKVCATLQALMKLEGNGEFDLNRTVSEYLPDTKGTNKANIVYKEILTHQAGLPSFIPFFAWLMDESGSGYKTGYFSSTKSKQYPIEIKKSLYGTRALPDSLRKWTYERDMRTRRNIYRPYSYRYSDIGFYLLKWTLEQKTAMQLDQYVDQNFYHPLGLATMTYLPLEKGISLRQIAPTEYDSDYRKVLVHGRVHDPGAALIGGVGGHAGVFSNANDVAILMQMNLQDGYYGGKRYFKAGTIDRFNTRPYLSNNNRRAIGWDKPVLSGHGGSTSKYSSHQTFGHTGFTGTCTWVDPKHNLVYVFLSNRVNPYARNTKLIKSDVRENILSAAYEAMGVRKQR